MDTVFGQFDVDDEYLADDAFTKGIGADEEAQNRNLLTQAAMALNLADDNGIMDERGNQDEE